VSLADIQKFKAAFEKAASRYLEIQGLNIELRFCKTLFFTMRASIKAISFFSKNRIYIIKVNLSRNDVLPKLSDDDLVGWFGHELAHILDYEAMSNIELCIFAFKYVCNLKFRFSVEKRVNAFTYNNGFACELFGVWKKFISLDNVNKRYKNYIAKNYLPNWEAVQESATLYGITKEDFELQRRDSAVSAPIRRKY
jgi:hypothetical protein